jgi:hypothetical protein
MTSTRQRSWTMFNRRAGRLILMLTRKVIDFIFSFSRGQLTPLFDVGSNS